MTSTPSTLPIFPPDRYGRTRSATHSRSDPGECDAAPVWNGTNLFLASNGTTINGTAYGGSIREVDPASGAVIWQKGPTGPIIGDPSEDGAGEIATATYSPKTGQNAVSLLNASTGKIRKTISYTRPNTFSQPVFRRQLPIEAGEGIVARTCRPG